MVGSRSRSTNVFVDTEPLVHGWVLVEDTRVSLGTVPVNRGRVLVVGVFIQNQGNVVDSLSSKESIAATTELLGCGRLAASWRTRNFVSTAKESYICGWELIYAPLWLVQFFCLSVSLGLVWFLFLSQSFIKMSTVLDDLLTKFGIQASQAHRHIIQ